MEKVEREGNEEQRDELENDEPKDHTATASNVGGPDDVVVTCDAPHDKTEEPAKIEDGGNDAQTHSDGDGPQV